MARPRKQISSTQVEETIAQGNTVEGTALIVGCQKATLHRRFAPAIERGRERRNTCLQKQQFDMAMGGDRTMAIWLGKQWLGQRDRQEHEISGPGGGAIQVEIAAVRQKLLEDPEYVEFCRLRASDADAGLFGGNGEQRLLGQSPSPATVRPSPNGNRNGNGQAGAGGDATPPRQE